MNTKTFFSGFTSFSEQWKKYKKQISPAPLGWIVISDYCLDDKNKNDDISNGAKLSSGSLFSKKIARRYKKHYGSHQ
jgi:hypothetical protein